MAQLLSVFLHCLNFRTSIFTDSSSTLSGDSVTSVSQQRRKSRAGCLVHASQHGVFKPEKSIADSVTSSSTTPSGKRFSPAGLVHAHSNDQVSVRNFWRPMLSLTFLTRIWQDRGDHYCQICRMACSSADSSIISQLILSQHQPIGFVYRCVQDHAGILPQYDFTSSTTTTEQNFEPDWEVRLSDWMVEAIDRGEYTPNQVQKLVEQKIAVKRAILAQSCPKTPPSSSSSVQSSNISHSADNSTFSSIPTTLDEELCAADQDERADLSLSNGSETEATPRVSVQLSICDFHCCHTCRPTYRERAWEILNKVVNEPCELPPSWELENRPISDARLLAQIGLSKPHDTYDDFQYLFTHEVDDKLSTQADETKSGRENALTRQRSHDFRHKSEFEQAVRNVIDLGAEESGFANQHSRHVSSSSGHDSLIRASRSLLFMRSVSGPASSHESATTGASTSQLSLTNTITKSGEVEVEDGVAVTEEGINLGHADIIMQV